MPKNQGFKRVVRARMEATGERYTEARQALEFPEWIVAVDSPDRLSPLASHLAKTLFQLLAKQGLVPRVSGEKLHRTAQEVADGIKALGALAAVLIVEDKDSGLLVEKVVDILDQRPGPTIPVGVLFSAKGVLRHERTRVRQIWRVAVGKEDKSMVPEEVEKLSIKSVPVFVFPHVLVDWLKEALVTPIEDRQALKVIATNTEVRAFLGELARALSYDSEIAREDIVHEVEVEAGPPFSVTIDTKKPGVLLGRGGETSTRLTAAIKEISGQEDVRFHIREILN